VQDYPTQDPLNPPVSIPYSLSLNDVRNPCSFSYCRVHVWKSFGSPCHVTFSGQRIPEESTVVLGMNVGGLGRDRSSFVSVEEVEDED